ncbi:DUF2076 domain-containing protein [Reyranella sp.]|uniref:DUF2076 domain-containing protein n=1 Tax=Reyranella sp. TaxID=1929291 RepID=UPI003D0C14A4
MQQQERDLIADLFGRLQQFENQPRDPEAERLIANYVSRQPSAVYLLTQTVIVQEEAMKQAKARIAELESKASETSFLGSAPKIGPWGSAPRAPQAPAAPAPWQAAPAAPQAAPSGQQAPMGAPAGGGGSFLRTALTTAAGVAGGALLFQGISSMFGHSTSQAFANPAMNPSSLLPPDQLSSPDYGQDVAAADTYDSTSDNSDFDDSGFDSSGDDNDI